MGRNVKLNLKEQGTEEGATLRIRNNFFSFEFKCCSLLSVRKLFLFNFSSLSNNEGKSVSPSLKYTLLHHKKIFRENLIQCKVHPPRKVPSKQFHPRWKSPLPIKFHAPGYILGNISTYKIELAKRLYDN